MLLVCVCTGCTTIIVDYSESVDPTDGWAYSVAFFCHDVLHFTMPPAHRILSAQIPATYHARQTADTSRNECSAVGSAIQYGMLWLIRRRKWLPSAPLSTINTTQIRCALFTKSDIWNHISEKHKTGVYDLILRTPDASFGRVTYAQWGFQKPGALLKSRFWVLKTQSQVSDSGFGFMLSQGQTCTGEEKS